MKIVAHNGFKEPVVLEITSLMVLDDCDNPIMGALWHQPGHIQVAHVNDKDFDLLMAILGADKKLVVDSYSVDGASWHSQTKQHPMVR